MTSEEFTLWKSYYKLNPWDGEWLQTGLMCSTIANYAGKVRSNEAGAAAPSDYMPPWGGNDADEEPDPVAHFGAIQVPPKKE